MASTGETEDPCGVPRSRCRKDPSGSAQRRGQPPLTYSTTHGRSVFAWTALTTRSHGTVSKNFRMSRSITQSVPQHRSRQAATASSAERPGGTRRSPGGRPSRPCPPALRPPPSARPGRPRSARPRSWCRPVRLRDLHRAHRRREVGPRRHPIPDLVQVALQILLEFLDRLPVHPGRALVRPDLLPRLPDIPLRDLKRLARRLQLVHATPPRELPVDRTNTATNDPAPSLRPHYRGFTATTSRSASASRDGTQPLAASAPLGALPLARPHSGRAVSGHAFSCSARKPQTGLASSTCRTPPGQSADSRQAHPGVSKTPRFRCHLSGFRHVSSDSLALAFPVPT